MDSESTQQHVEFLSQAIDLAHEAGRLGNLPIGAVIVLDGEIVARGLNAIWKPELALTRHAEMEAMRATPSSLWERAGEMILYSTLEPCLMCAGAIFLHGIGQVIYGSADPYGGVGTALGSLPLYFSDRLASTNWEGPALPDKCDPLYRRIQELVGFQSMG